MYHNSASLGLLCEEKEVENTIYISHVLRELQEI